jgi:hypothetical protein
LERWADVDNLMRRLGALRAAADGSRVKPGDRADIEDAISKAAQAVDEIIEAPQDAKGLAAARSAFMTAEELVERALKGRR